MNENDVATAVRFRTCEQPFQTEYVNALGATKQDDREECFKMVQNDNSE